MPDKPLTDVINLGRMILQFGRTYRATFHEDGVTPESDTDHTVMLGVIACAYAERYAPQLDRGRIAEFAFVHDLVEVYAQDTPTLHVITETARREKEEREHAALARIVLEFGEAFPWIPTTISAYDSLNSPEARWIKALDKVLPKITHILNSGVTVAAQGHTSVEDLRQVYDQQRQQIVRYAAEWPEVVMLWESIVSELYHTLDKPSDSSRIN